MDEKKGFMRLFSNYCDCYELVNVDTGLMGRKTFVDLTMSESEMTMDYQASLEEQVNRAVHPLDRPKAREMMSLANLRRLSDLRKVQENYIFRSYDHKRNVIYAELQIRLYYNNGRHLALICTKNLSQYEKREHELAAEMRTIKESDDALNINKEGMLYQMAKDIRRPIHNIVGMCKIASINDGADKQIECMEEVQKESLRILNMVEEVVDMSRLAERQLHLHPVLFDLAEETQRIAGGVADKLKEKDLRLRVYVDNIRFEHLIGDVDRIRQVYTYILLNAIKDSYPGTIIKVWIKELDYYNANNTIVQLIFENQGKGMSRDLVDAMENPFHKRPGHSQWGLSGEGYGIPLAKELILLMNGHFLVESEPDKGTRITVSLERSHRDGSAYEIEEELKHLKLLLLSNDPLLAKDAVDILKKMDIYAETMDIEAFKGQKMSEKLDAMQQYDVVMFPREIADESNIFYVRDQLKGKGPKLILTAYDWDALEHMTGMDAYLKKPFYASSLRIALKQAMGLISKEEKNEQPLWLVDTNVLVVEDNEQNQEILVELLKNVGCNIRVAENGFVAKEMVSQKPDGFFDLIIMDIIMPLMDGYESTREIRRLPLNYAKTIPIVALSANTSWEDKEKCKGAGMNAHLAKPIEVKRLHEVLRNFLSDKCLQ